MPISCEAEKSISRSRFRLLAASISMPRRPPIDVALPDQLAHQPHSLALLVAGASAARASIAGGHAFGVVRIDDQRLGQLARGAGEARQHQHALLVVARGHEFLGHQVHAVVQAGDDADVGGAEQLEDLVRLVMADDAARSADSRRRRSRALMSLGERSRALACSCA